MTPRNAQNSPRTAFWSDTLPADSGGIATAVKEDPPVDDNSIKSSGGETGAVGQRPRSERSDKIIDIKRGRLVNQTAATYEMVYRTEAARKTLHRVFYKGCLLLSGQTVASLLSLVILWAALAAFSLFGNWAFQALAGLVVIRTWYFHTRGPRPVLGMYKVRKRSRRLLVDEGKISLYWLALCFVMSWPVTVPAAAAFVAGNLLLQLCLMSVSRFVIKALVKHEDRFGGVVARRQRALVVGTGANAQRVADSVLEAPELDTRLVGFLDYHQKGFWRYRDIPLIGHPGCLGDVIANSQVDAIFCAVEPEDVPRSWELLQTADRMGVRVFVMPNLYDPQVARVRPAYINGLPALVYRSDPESHVPLLVKSLLDKAGALLGIMLAAPVMLLTAMVVKLDSRGPILFKQMRAGMNGRPFLLYKFRTMCSDAEAKKKSLWSRNEMSGPVFKIKEDPRVTRVGKFLRKFSIDELPQLFNVLKGEMSLVGPRPPLPGEVSHFEPWQHRKLSVRPGLTCLWQVNGRNNVDFEEWMRMDLQYIDNWSLWLDAKILAKTIPAVVSGTGR